MSNNISQKTKVILPEKFKTGYTGDIYGKYIEETDIFNIYTPEMIEILNDATHLGKITEKKEEDSTANVLTGFQEGEELIFEYKGRRYAVEYYNLLQNVFSRNTGILESDVLNGKCAIIVGCGSVGSLAALELAKSGVGKFVLIDNDVFEYHNICRHQCSIGDVGRFKTHAVRERILRINPAAKVECQEHIMELVPKTLFDDFCIQGESIIFGCADDRAADVYANSVAVSYGVPFISAGCWERAAAGEVFYWLPDKNMPCYECAIGATTGISGRNSVNRRIYTNMEELENVNFEPGISVDINFVTTVAVKLALDILNMGSEKYTVRLLDHLRQYTLICNTNNPKIGGEAVEIFYKPLMITDSLVVNYCEGCPPCRYGGREDGN